MARNRRIKKEGDGHYHFKGAFTEQYVLTAPLFVRALP